MSWETERKIIVISSTSSGQSKVLMAIIMLAVKPLAREESEEQVTCHCTWRRDAQSCLPAGDCSQQCLQAFFHPKDLSVVPTRGCFMEWNFRNL